MQELTMSTTTSSERFGYREAVEIVEHSLRKALRRDQEQERRARRLAATAVSPFDKRGLALPWRREPGAGHELAASADTRRMGETRRA